MTSTPLVAKPTERTLPDQIEHRVACEILRGERLPGSRLPTVRALSEHHGVTIPTIQRALDRLGRTGLVTAKRGSGVTVNDPKRNMNLSLIPVWFEALAAEPQAAAKILRDFLALRRILTRHLFEVSPELLVASLPKLAIPAAALATATDLREVAIADAQMSRIIVEAIDNIALSAFFYTVEQLALEVPHIAESLYGDRALHQQVILQVMEAFTDPNRVGSAQALQTVFERWDAQSVQTYTDRLIAENRAHRARRPA